MKKLLFIFSLILMSYQCASKDFNEPGILAPSDKPTHRAYNASYGDVWKAAYQAMGAKKYPIASALRESGTLTTDWVLGKSDRLYSGYGDTRIPYNIRFKFTVTIKPTQKGVNVTVQNSEQYMSDPITAGSDFQGSIYQWIACESSTEKEASYLSEVENQLNMIRNQVK